MATTKKKTKAAKASGKKAKTPAKKAAKKSIKAKAKSVAKPARAKVKPKAAAKVTGKVKKKPAPALRSKPGPMKTKNAKENRSGVENFSPLEDRVLVLRDEVLERTPGGLYIPNASSEKPRAGKVVSVGPGRKSKKGRLHPLDVQLGDRVLFGEYAGTTVQILDQEFLLLKEDEILGIEIN